MRSATLTLDQLAAVGLVISQHEYTPRSDQWFVNGEGEYESPEAAILDGIKRNNETAIMLKRILNEDTTVINNLILAVRHIDAAAMASGHGYILPASLFQELHLAIRNLDLLDQLHEREAHVQDDEE